MELTLRQMCDLHFKFEEDRTKTAVAIESDRYFGRTDGRTDKLTLQVILYSVQCHALHWTDNKKTTSLPKVIWKQLCVATGCSQQCAVAFIHEYACYDGNFAA